MLTDLLTAPAPTVRSDLTAPILTIISVRRAAMDYHDLVLQTQAEDAAHATAIEQTQQTMGAMVRELGVLLDQCKKVQTIGDQLDHVRDELRSA